MILDFRFRILDWAPRRLLRARKRGWFAAGNSDGSAKGLPTRHPERSEGSHIQKNPCQIEIPRFAQDDGTAGFPAQLTLVGGVNSGSAGRNRGFTLIEVMAALAILGTSLIVLLNSHYKAMTLHADTDQAVFMDGLTAWALGLAEVEVLAGVLDDAGDFGERYPGYSYAFHATLFDETVPVRLYTVGVTVVGPDDERMLMMLVYDMGADGMSGAS